MGRVPRIAGIVAQTVVRGRGLPELCGVGLARKDGSSRPQAFHQPTVLFCAVLPVECRTVSGDRSRQLEGVLDRNWNAAQRRNFHRRLSEKTFCGLGLLTGLLIQTVEVGIQ